MYKRQDLCRTETPELIEVAPGRSAACWGYSEREGRPDVGPAVRRAGGSGAGANGAGANGEVAA